MVVQTTELVGYEALIWPRYLVFRSDQKLGLSPKATIRIRYGNGVASSPEKKPWISIHNQRRGEGESKN